MLEAEFTAFALVIIYGGAILVTYLFVIMLAAQSGDPHDDDEAADYNRVAFEPVAAVVAGFLLLAVLATAIFERGPRGLAEVSAAGVAGRDVVEAAGLLTDRPADRLAERLLDQDAGEVSAAVGSIRVIDNTERVGLDLFREHPLGLELAGVILLASLIGAVVLARRKLTVEGQEDSDPAAGLSPDHLAGGKPGKDNVSTPAHA